ncbi:MAG TPA: hypothetical protein VE243_02800, partial [Candidatus Acidoferrum sp.]|nr:hypothetical protein [Candidatus Acidoferrum sp.]
MKRIALWAMGIGLISCVGVTTVEFAYAEEKEHATTCSLATMKGRYLFATNATNFLPPANQQQLFARAGVHIFNGDGTGTNLATTSVNGVITVTDNFSDLSYTVNEDCTGTFKVLSIPIPGPTAEMFIAPNGEQMVVIE